MDPFVFTTLPSRVLFGAGALSMLPAEIARLDAKRVLLLSTPGRTRLVASVAALLGPLFAGSYDKAVMHVPVSVAEDARRVARELGADCCVAVGGGSTVGLGKAIALTTAMPVVCVPTTYSGSEMTTILGMTDGGRKTTLRDARVLPKVVVYDPELTLGLPPALSAASGINAIAHSVEALYAHDANPVVSLMAEESIRALGAALPAVVAAPSDIGARGDALYGAWLAGSALGAVGMALHHKLCHVLGGTFNLPHAQTHAILLPHAVHYNAAAAPQAMQRVARALGAGDAAGGLHDLGTRLGIPMRLADIGMPEDGIERAARIAVEAPYPNPRPVEYAPVLALLRNAWAGRRPGQA